MAVTLKFQSSGTVPGNARPVQLQGGSLTVGRGPANDLVLPDPEKMLSKSHFVIEDQNGNAMIVDLSTNGTFLNYSKVPIGRNPTPLNNGDVLVLGNYELIVQIDDAPSEQAFDPNAIADPLGPLPGRGAPQQIPDPLGENAVSPGDAGRAPDPLDLLEDPGPGGGDFIDDLLGPDKTPTGPSQLNPTDPIDELLPPAGEDEHPFFDKPSDGREGTGASIPAHNPSASDSFRPQATGGGANVIPDDWDDLLEGVGGAPEPAAPPPQPQPQPRANAPKRTPPIIPPEDQDTPAAAQPPAAEPAAPDPAPAEPTPQKAPAAPAPSSEQSGIAEAFLAALGAEGARLDPAEMPKTMARMGRVMKTLITGLREILMTRTSIKSEFRIEQTRIGAGGNNPLKFSISPEQAIDAMVQPVTKGYLSPESAVEEALQDIKAHEVAMVTGMEAALKGVLEKLNPEQLAAQLESSGGLSGLLKGKKARYWEVYEKLYAEISDQAENDFHDLFSREFARAYQEQLNKLKN